MTTHYTDKTLGVLGGGNMAEAIIRGVLDADLLPAARITVYDPLPARRAVFAALGCAAPDDACAAARADVVLTAVKPQVYRAAVGAVAAALAPQALVVSIAAGVPCRTIEALLPAGTRVIRVMPNTPLLAGCGMSCLARGTHATQDDMACALELFACAGTALETNESAMDAVTALSGSGPAYIFRFAEALMAGGEQIGLTPDQARLLTIKTLSGAAAMLERTQDAATLRRNVTSPGGTTAAALRVLDDADLMGTAARALAAARDRSIELGRDL